MTVGYEQIGSDGLFVANVCNTIYYNNATSAVVNGQTINPNNVVDSAGQTLA